MDAEGTVLGDEDDGSGVLQIVNARVRFLRINPIGYGLFATFSNDLSIEARNSEGSEYSIGLDNGYWIFEDRAEPRWEFSRTI